MSWDAFQRTVQATLASKRLGTPVFVRCLAQHAVAAKAAPAFLAHLVHIVNGWLAQPLDRIYALGTVKNRHVTLTMQYQAGASAQLTWVGQAPGGPGVDLMLVGNHGAIYHDLAPLGAWDVAEPAPKELLAWMNRALASAQPEAADK
jgi:hypothetical protein